MQWIIYVKAARIRSYFMGYFLCLVNAVQGLSERIHLFLSAQDWSV
jgi:hypothetical protein